MMYDELIRQMKACCKGLPCEEVNCGFNSKSDLDCIEQLLTKAADAIDELQLYESLYKDLTEKSQKVTTELKQQLQKSEADNTNLTGWLAEEHAKHQWIPVTERLPEYMDNVLVTDGYFTGMGWLDYDDWRGTRKREVFWMSPNCNVNEENITHWMPLPQPPKEEHDDKA